MKQRAPRRFVLVALIGLSSLVLGPASLIDRAAAGPPATPRQKTVPPAGGQSAPVSEFDIFIPAAEFGKTEEGFDTVLIPGYGESAGGGDPTRPLRIFPLAIPAGAVPRVEILDADFYLVYRFDLAPVPLPHPDLPGGPGHRKTPRQIRRRNGASYSRPGFSTGAPVEIGAVGYVRNMPYAQLRVLPLEYDPVLRLARIFTRIRIRIFLEESAGHGPVPRPDTDGRFESVYRLAFSGGAVLDWESNGGASTTSPSPIESSDPAIATSSQISIGSTTAAAGAFPAYRIPVSDGGIYRLTYEYLDDPARAASLIALNPDPAEFRLTSQGQEIPIRVMNTGNLSLFEPGEFIEFYGQPLEGDFLSPDVYEQGDFTDINIYRLSVEPGVHARIQERAGDPVSGFPVPASFRNREKREESGLFLGQLPFDGAEHWYALPMIREGRDSGNNPIPGATDFTVTLAGTGPPGTARIEVRILGMSYTDNFHRTAIAVNGTEVAAAEDWDGFQFHIQGADFNAALLNEGTNTITILTPLGRVNGAGSPVGLEADLLDTIEITYDRNFLASSGRLSFEQANLDSRFQIGAAGVSPVVYETTRFLPGSTLRDPIRITGGTVNGTILTLEVAADGTLPAGTTRTYAFASGTGFLLPDSVDLDLPGDLRSILNGADYIVIGHRDLLDTSIGTNLDQVLQMRQTQGLRTRVVEVQDVYDEFSFGIQDPQAIRDFLQYAFFNWQPPAPLYVVLLGDATYDTKNHYGAAGTRNFVPTYNRDDSDALLLGYFADDTYFAAIAGADPLPDLFLGRIPAHNLAEAETVWGKILDYELAGGGAAWQSNALFVADQGDFLFESVQDQQINNHLLGTPHTFDKIYYQEIIDANPGIVDPQDLADIATGQVQAAIDSGAALINFVGHGGFQQWSQFPNIFQTLSNQVPPGDTPVFDDIDPLSNGPRYPFMINTNCITGAFQITGQPGLSQTDDQSYSFAEDFLLTGGKGLIAALAPSHLTFSFILHIVNNTIFEEMYGITKERNLGKIQMALRIAFEQSGLLQDLQNFIFLGDPATNLRIPAPRAPAGVNAVGANQRVDITWTASPEAATYNLYRAGNPSGPYFRINSSPITGTSFADLAVINTVTYHYSVTSVDAGGFEGAFSNFNTDCATSGPDCVRAVPLNPDPPAVPTGITAADLGTGGAVILAWNPNPEPDLNFYTLNYGTAAGIYDQEIQVNASKTSFTLSGLVDGVNHFFALTATNTSGNVSGFSAEATAIPRLLLGISPPRAVQGLQVTIAGADLQLTWTPVDTDILGDPATIDSYSIYSSSLGPDFLLETNELATVAGTVTTFLHVGAAADPNPHYYLVAARDADGFLSGASRELPASVQDVRVQRIGGTELQFDWNPISTDIDGNPTIISHYVLYFDTSPFSRSQVGPALLLLDNIAAPPVQVPMAPGNGFYSVLAVDNRGLMSPF